MSRWSLGGFIAAVGLTGFVGAVILVAHGIWRGWW